MQDGRRINERFPVEMPDVPFAIRALQVLSGEDEDLRMMGRLFAPWKMYENDVRHYVYRSGKDKRLKRIPAAWKRELTVRDIKEAERRLREANSAPITDVLLRVHPERTSAVCLMALMQAGWHFVPDGGETDGQEDG